MKKLGAAFLAVAFGASVALALTALGMLIVLITWSQLSRVWPITFSVLSAALFLLCWGLKRRTVKKRIEKEKAEIIDMVEKALEARHRGGSPEVPGGRVDLVHFSVTSPPSVEPGTAFVIDVWAHLERQRKEVIRRAQQAAAKEEIYIASQGPLEVARGTVLTVCLKIEDFIVEPSEATVLWKGEIGNATFGVRVPKDAKRGRRVGIATIHMNGRQIALVHFALDVGKKSASVAQIKPKVQRHRTAFASYASADRDKVMLVVQGLRKGLPGLDIFVDVDSLRAGQKWKEELWRVIPSRDVFYLFWSAHASKSTWVEQEWRCALRRRGLDFIDPCPLVSPKEVPPPKELESLHFYDRWLSYRRNKESNTVH